MLQALVDTLNLDFVGLRFSDTVLVLTRIGAAFGAMHDPERVTARVEQLLKGDLAAAGSLYVDGDEIRIWHTPLGHFASLGNLVAGSRRPDFPRREEVLAMSLAAMQTCLAFREVHELSQRSPPADLRSDKPTGEALAESEWRLNLTINTIPAMAWSATPDGMLDFCNQHFLDFVGLPSEEIMRLGFYRIFHTDDMPHLLSTWQTIMASGSAREVEGRIRRADGQYRWCTLRQNPLRAPDGSVVKWYGVVLDIEDRKRAENALKATEAALIASEKNLSVTINSLPVLVWSARPDGSADFVNQSWIDYAGVSAEYILEWGFLEFYHPDDVPGMVEIWKRDLEHSDHTVLTGRIRRHDGQYRWFLFSGRKLTDANGVVRWFGCNVDIEDLQRAEEDLRRSQSELAHMTRMVTISELAVSIAHEINQPLMAIVTNAGTCLRWLDDKQVDVGRAKQAAQRIVEDGHRAGDIVASLRALSRKSAPRLERMDLQQVIRDVLDLVGGELQRQGIVSRLELAHGVTTVLGDSIQLQQVVLNLIVNAIEAMSAVEVGRRSLAITTQSLAGDVYVTVQDSGSGLNPEHANKMFEAFFSTKPEGIGMGLSICRSIVEAHGGRIWASPNEPHGSMFSFTVPTIGGAKLSV